MTNSASMELGYMDFVGDFSVIWTFSIINCSIWTILAGTNVVHISEIGCTHDFGTVSGTKLLLETHLYSGNCN